MEENLRMFENELQDNYLMWIWSTKRIYFTGKRVCDGVTHDQKESYRPYGFRDGKQKL